MGGWLGVSGGRWEGGWVCGLGRWVGVRVYVLCGVHFEPEFVSRPHALCSVHFEPEFVSRSHAKRRFTGPSAKPSAVLCAKEVNFLE